MSVLDILKGSVVNKDGSVVNLDGFTGKGTVLALYFSAHWCPPCRGFTPKLAEFYNNFKKNSADKPFEVVFVSSDNSQEEFDSYYSEMPWLALKYEKRTEKATLSKKFKVNGIPTFVILDGETGNVITKDGRSAVMSDPQGAKYPWYPPKFVDVIKGELVKNDQSTQDSSILDGKVKLLYFSAHWCPPCKAFTPNLTKFYNKLKEDGKYFEIVFVSGDQDENSFGEYFGTMPWFALPFEDNRCDQLNTLFEVQGIPCLIVLDENNKVITEDGREMVDEDPEGKDFPWHPKPLLKLGSSAISKINEEVCVIYFTDGSKEEVEKAKAAMDEVSKVHKAKGDKQELFFLYSEGGDLASRLIEFTGLPKDKTPFLTILNISDDMKYECDKNELDKETVENFVSDYIQGKLEGKAFK